jgi:hypothetical protein
MLVWTFLLTLSCFSAQSYDDILHQPVDHTFLSVGSGFLDDRAWASFTTTSNQFVKDTIVLASLPQTNGVLAAVKVRQQTTLNADKTVSFSLKLVQPNDSFCSQQFYVPKFLNPTPITWMVMEVGAYTVINNVKQTRKTLCLTKSP